MRTRLIISIILSCIALSLQAQKGTLRGVVYEEASGEFLPGVSIYVEGTTTGTITDLDGKFNLSLNPGTYTLKISFISYDPIILENLSLQAGQVLLLDDLALKEATVQLNEVTVTAQAVRNTETALMAIKRKSPNVLDGISAVGLRKIGDSDAASAMKRVTGVSVANGKYVYVRGLGDRYTKTTLNGVDIPGLDPDRNTLQMDIFPTNIIDNLIVNKSFSADLPADFTGGLIDIGTKDFPEEKITSITVGAGYNPGSHFNSDFLSYEGGKTDWLGFDDGTRRNPIDPNDASMNPNTTVAILARGIHNHPEGPNYRNALESFNPVMAAKKETSFMDYNLGIAMGNQQVKKKVTLGYNLALSYKSETDFYQDAIDSKYALANGDPSLMELERRDYQKGNIGISSVFVSGLGGFAIKTTHSRYRIKLMHLQNGESTAGIFERAKNNQGSGFSGIQHNLEYSQRALTNLLLDGKHNYPANDWSIEWKLSPTLSKMNEPDIRITQYEITDDGSYSVGKGQTEFPQRAWRDLKEVNATGLFHITKGFALFDRKSKLQFGGLYTYKERDYAIAKYSFPIKGNFTLEGNPNEIFYPENLWPMADNPGDGTTVTADHLPTNYNQYNSRAANTAGYLKTEISPLNNLKAMLGVRVENFRQYYTGLGSNPDGSDRLLNDSLVMDDLNFFPEVNLVYTLTKQINIRVSYSQTIARPSFKELSYAQIYDPISSTYFNGGFYPDRKDGVVFWDGQLKSTLIQNYDLRWEMYFEDGQMVSLGAFYKTFDNPIEIVQYASAPGQLQPRNVGNGTVLGTEMEFRLNLGTLADPLHTLSLSSNVTLITSEIDRSKTEYDDKVENARQGESISTTRRMAGMSPYLVNGGLSYQGEKDFFKGLEAGLYYNIQGLTLEYVGVTDRPDIYTLPFQSLNFNSSLTFGKSQQYKLGFKILNLLNDSKEMVYKSYRAEDQYFKKRNPGRSFTLNFSYSLK